MPANGRWDLIRRLKVKSVGASVLYYTALPHRRPYRNVQSFFTLAVNCIVAYFLVWKL